MSEKSKKKKGSKKAGEKITTLGHMKFKRALNKMELKIIKEIDLESIVELDDWWFAEGQFGYQNCNLIFEVCQQITATDLDFHDNQRETIIKQICHIDFPNLTYLKLSMNVIESMEHIQHLKAINLTKLILNGNYITQTKSIRKCNFPQLQSLHIHENKIIDVSFLSQCYFPQLTSLHLQYEQDEQYPTVENINAIFKMKINLKQLSWDEADLKMRQPIKIMLNKKFPKMLQDDEQEQEQGEEQGEEQEEGQDQVQA